MDFARKKLQSFSDQRSTDISSHDYAIMSGPKNEKEHRLIDFVTKLKNSPKAISKDSAAMEKRCWEGYQPVPGKKPYTKGSCVKKAYASKATELDKNNKNTGFSSVIQQLRNQKEAARQGQLEQFFGSKGQAVPQHLKQPTSTTIDYNQVRQEFKQKQRQASNIQSSPPKRAPFTGYTQPAKLYDSDFSGTVDYKTDYKKYKNIAKSQAKVIPAMVSEPIIQNRFTHTKPIKISGPNIMDGLKQSKMEKCTKALKKMIGCLKKVDPKTKLPGILLDKKVKHPVGKNISITSPLKRSSIEKFDNLVKAWGASLNTEPSIKPSSSLAAPKKQASIAQPKIKSNFGTISKMKMSSMKKDDRPHPPGSPEERSHAVVEEGADFQRELKNIKQKGKGAVDKFLSHLRSLKGRPDRLRSPENVIKKKA